MYFVNTTTTITIYNYNKLHKKENRNNFVSEKSNVIEAKLQQNNRFVDYETHTFGDYCC